MRGKKRERERERFCHSGIDGFDDLWAEWDATSLCGREEELIVRCASADLDPHPKTLPWAWDQAKKMIVNKNIDIEARRKKIVTKGQKGQMAPETDQSFSEGSL
jgi:hypothetical protein